jgi:hypothetical protein
MWVADVPLQIENNLPQMEVSINDVGVTLGLDSGAYVFGVTLTPAERDGGRTPWETCSSRAPSWSHD